MKKGVIVNGIFKTFMFILGVAGVGLVLLYGFYKGFRGGIKECETFITENFC